MHRSACPFAAALFGSIARSAAGAAVGAVSGWLIYAAYAASGGRDVQGFALLAFGTLGMGVGGSGGAVGGMVEGWALVEAKGPAEASAARWGACLGGLWALQPILWLGFTAESSTALAYGTGIAAIVTALGAVAGMIGGLAARSVVRALGVGRASALSIRKDCR
jgi:hypothetical protein